MTTTKYRIEQHSGAVRGTVSPASSKSESNRALIIDALTGYRCHLQNISDARDTRTMRSLLQETDTTWDVLDAGTTMRFLTAYAVATNQHKILTGTKRMCERPIGILVDALKTLGGKIEYLGEEGYPPLEIKGFHPVKHRNHIQIKGNVSSQYISALLMIAPTLPEGLNLELTGTISSLPYIEMTRKLMAHFGVETQWEGQSIKVPAKNYTATSYFIESDWSSASYWYSIAALSPEAGIQLKGLKKFSFQGDSIISEMMENFGVHSHFTENGVELTHKGGDKDFHGHFGGCPDLAQTIAVVAAAKGNKAVLDGVESLRIKETDRIEALKNELEKFNAKITVEGNSRMIIHPAELEVNGQKVATYKDHRMAMAFAPLALLGPVTIENPSVVEKSYPGFWSDMKNTGFKIKEP